MRNFLIVSAIVCVTASGCIKSRAITNELTKTPPPPVEREGYSPLMFTTWTLADKTTVEARIEVLKTPSQQSKPSSSAYRLLIKNTGSNETVFEQTSYDRPISMYARDLNDDWNDELILTWAGGIEILSVGSHTATSILDESYRVDAALIDLSGRGKIDVLITTGDTGAGPFYVTRYAWQNEKYTSVGRMRYDIFIRTVMGLAK
ncbi:MAG TPA: hypothetical protein DC054_07390 [Blastocatellia bacterium]|nr:hypothetical protein [Blastocatellia bacterium]